MAEPAEPSRSLAPVLTDWLVRQRWFSGDAVSARLALIGALPLPLGQAEARAETLFVVDRDPAAAALYQVPIVRRTGPVAEDVPGRIGSVDGEVLIDGPHDPAYAAALLALILGGGSTDAGADTALSGVPLDWHGPLPDLTGSRVLSGEQSNTSIILELAGDDLPAAAAIVKVFRALQAGENPDVVLQSAVSAAGSDRVPRTFGALTGRWPDEGGAEGTASGHLAVAQEFLAGTEDAWRVALGAAREGEDFRAAARALGVATAEVHRVLADRFGAEDATENAERALLASMRTRADQAVALVPELAEHADAIVRVLGGAAGRNWPPLQRVHGDYHLGQVLLVPERGWVLLDFEGEPLRPMAERSAPDLPLRDVAGMLRSFDYVAGTIRHEGGDADAWSAQARRAFLDGYDAASGGGLERQAALLRALELDKALYECQYEVRARPDWLPIPRDAALRLLEGTP